MGFFGSIYSDVLTKALKALSFLVLVVVVLLGCLFYFEDDNEKTHEFLVKLEEEIHYQTKKSVDDNPYDRLKSKIEIDTEFKNSEGDICKGYSYLQPNQISHMKTIPKQRKVEITIQGQVQKLYTTATLSDLECKVNKKDELFFRAKSSLVNYNYTQGVVRESKKRYNKEKGKTIYRYRDVVIMENKDKIKINKEKYLEAIAKRV